jgi:signal transduction histidine kinase
MTPRNIWRFVTSNLRFRLLIFVLMGAAPAIVFLIFNNRQQHQLIESNLKQHTEGLAQTTAIGIGNFIMGTEQFLIALANIPEIETGDFGVCNNFAAEYFKNYKNAYPLYINMVVLDSSGNVICSNKPIPTNPPLNFSDRPWIKRVFETKQFTIGEYTTSRISGDPTIAFTYPIIKNQNVSRIVGISLDLNKFNELLAKEGPVIEGAVLMILDREGTIIAREPKLSGFVGKSLAEFLPELSKQILSGNKEAVISSGLDGIQRVYTHASFSKNNNPAIHIAIGFSEQLLVGEQQSLAVSIFTRSALGLFILIVFTFLIFLFGGDILILRRARKIIEAEALIESIGDGVIFINKNSKILTMNSAAQEVLGCPGNKCTGGLINDMFKLSVEDEAGNQIKIERPIIEALLTGKKVKSSGVDGHTFYYTDKSGRKVPLALTASPVLLYGAIIGAVTVFRSIQKEIEIERSKTEFIYLVSHQLRTPVSALSWVVESLEFSLKGLDEKQKIYFDNINSSVKRLVKLVEDLLVVSRAWLGKLTTDKIEVDLEKFVKKAIEDMKQYAVLKEHTIEFKKIVNPCAVITDPKLLYNALQNLLANAIEYSPENTTVTVELSSASAEHFPKISVYNKGPAIPKEEQAHLFEKFYRGESVKKLKAEGTGLGLFIVKSLIEKIGGKVGFESEEGKDTVFWFMIPCIHIKK